MPATQTWTTRTLLDWIAEAFAERHLDSPRLFAEMLVAHVLETERLKLYLDPDRPATPDERETLRDLVRRALQHEPIQYLVGEAWFFGMPFKADRRALIPRPSTETLVEHVLQHARTRPLELIADVCTGSGCISCAIAKQTEANLIATDVSAEALSLAKLNVSRHELGDQIEFREGDLLGPIMDDAGKLDAIVSNPPYIPDDEWGDVEPNVKQHEPELALRGGVSGMDLVMPLLEHGPDLLQEGGLLAIELAAARARDAARIVEADHRLTGVRVLRDIDGLDRVLVAERC